MIKEATDTAVRTAKRAAERNPALLQRVEAAESAGEVKRAKALAATVTIKLPNTTVVKRKRMAEALPDAAPPTPPALNELEAAWNEARARSATKRRRQRGSRCEPYAESADQTALPKMQERPRPVGVEEVRKMGIS